MAKIEVYCSGFCAYCVMAERLLQSKGLEFHTIRVDQDSTRFEEMITRSQRRTVPQIFIDGHHVGGYTDLAQLDRNGELDKLLT